MDDRPMVATEKENGASALQDAEWSRPVKKKVVKVLMGIPNEGGTHPEAYDNRIAMGIHLGGLQVLSSLGKTKYDDKTYDYPEGIEYQFSLGVVGKVLTPIARQRLAEVAVGSEFDYLFMIDDDMIAPADLFEQLVKHDKDITSALAFTRNAPHRPVIYNLQEGYDKFEKKNYYVNHSVINYPKNQLVECDAVGFGTVLIKCSVLRGMKKPWFTTTSAAGEDIHFCHMAKKAGYKVFMDTSVKLTHLGYPKQITEEVYEEEANMQELREVYGDENKYG